MMAFDRDTYTKNRKNKKRGQGEYIAPTEHKDSLPPQNYITIGGKMQAVNRRTARKNGMFNHKERLEKPDLPLRNPEITNHMAFNGRQAQRDFIKESKKKLLEEQNGKDIAGAQ